MSKFEGEGKGERGKARRWSAWWCDCALAQGSHPGEFSIRPAAGGALFPKQHGWSRPWALLSQQVTPPVHALGEPLDICLGRSRCTLANCSAVVLNSHISGRTKVLPLTRWGSASSLGSTSTFIPCEQNHLPFCGGCSRCGWHSLAEFSREFWPIKKNSNAYGWSN